MRILGIESSCDETAVAIYDGEKGLLSHVVYTQVEMHRRYGGVVPELASRDHIQKIIPLLNEALSQADLNLSLEPDQNLARLSQKASIFEHRSAAYIEVCEQRSTDNRGFSASIVEILNRLLIDAVAYTNGPGLMGALLVGALFGRTLAWGLNIPAIAVHHMEGHLLAPLLETPSPAFPFVALLVSGGHTQLISVEALGRYTLLGESMDDAAGEAFDKTARLLGLDYPGGPQLAKLAETGNSSAFHFPRPMTNRPGLDFSFSGLKTAVAQHVIGKKFEPQQLADIASSVQQAIVDTLTIKSQRALEKTGLKRLVVTGGVSANTVLRRSLQEMAKKMDASVYFPRLDLCTDNAAMIAFAGYHRLKAGQTTPLAVEVKPRWKLEDLL